MSENAGEAIRVLPDLDAFRFSLDEERCAGSYAILRAHCIFDNYLERVLKKWHQTQGSCPDPCKNYKGKLLECQRHGLLSDEVVELLSNLNELRNKLAHRVHYRISKEAIENIFSGISTRWSLKFEDTKWNDCLVEYSREAMSMLFLHVVLDRWHQDEDIEAFVQVTARLEELIRELKAD